MMTLLYFDTASEFRLTVPWGEMRGQVWGPSHGRPVLCLHGWADNSGTFNTLIPLLPKGIVFDSREEFMTIMKIHIDKFILTYFIYKWQWFSPFFFFSLRLEIRSH